MSPYGYINMCVFIYVSLCFKFSLWFFFLPSSLFLLSPHISPFAFVFLSSLFSFLFLSFFLSFLLSLARERLRTSPTDEDADIITAPSSASSSSVSPKTQQQQQGNMEEKRMMVVPTYAPGIHYWNSLYDNGRRLACSDDLRHRQQQRKWRKHKHWLKEVVISFLTCLPSYRRTDLYLLSPFMHSS